MWDGGSYYEGSAHRLPRTWSNAFSKKKEKDLKQRQDGQWKERNNRLLQGVSTHEPHLQEKIKMDIKLWIDAEARRLGYLKRE